MKAEDFKVMHLVSLSGGRTTTNTLVGPKTFDWLLTSFPSTKYQVNEKIPDEVMEEFSVFEPNWRKNNERGDVEITRKNFENDRALQAIGLNFESASQACKWANENKIELGDDFEGCILGFVVGMRSP